MGGVPAKTVRRRRVEKTTAPNLASLDLNLLVVFEALLVERSVTGAGRRLGLSQPATSAALARLRAMLADKLFVRGKSGLETTERCDELAAPLCKALVDLRNVLAGSSFDPATTTREIRIGAVDAAIAVWMPRVLARTMREAPHARVQVIAINPARATEALLDGSLDLALTPVPSPSPSVRSRPLYSLELVAVVRRSHPILKKKTRATLESFPRAHVTFDGMKRVAAPVLLGSYLAVPPLLAESDAWALLPSPYAEALARQGQVATVPAPEGLAHPKLTMQLMWPEAQDAAPTSKWLRQILLDVTDGAR